MPKIVRKGDSLSTGHGCVGSTTLDTPSQGTVFAEGILVARIGDPTVAHPFPPDPPCNPHISSLGAGSATVFVHGIGVGRLNDAADAGAMTGSASTVYAGD